MSERLTQVCGGCLCVFALLLAPSLAGLCAVLTHMSSHAEGDFLPTFLGVSAFLAAGAALIIPILTFLVGCAMVAKPNG